MQQTVAEAIVAAKTCSEELSRSCPNLSTRADNLRSHYPSYKLFFEDYNPIAGQIEYGTDERNAIMQDSSPIEVLDVAYKSGCAAAWLAEHIGELNTFSGSKNMDDAQVKNLARMLAAEYKDMKISQMMLFFYRFKRGDFGKFYGMVDPMVITCALKDFVSDCEAKRSRYLQEEYERKDNERREQLAGMRALWHRFRTALEGQAVDDVQRKLFASLTPLFQNAVTKVLTLAVTREQHDKLEGEYFDLFKSVFTRFYPDYRLLYRLSSAVSAEEVTNP